MLKKHYPLEKISLQCFQCFPNLEQPARHVETAFPFSTFQWQQHLSPAVEVTKTVGKNVVRLHQWFSFAGERKVTVQISVVPVFLQEFRTMQCHVEPLLFLFHFIEQRGKHPDFAALQPNKFIGIKHLSFAVETGEIAAKLLIF